MKMFSRALPALLAVIVLSAGMAPAQDTTATRPVAAPTGLSVSSADQAALHAVADRSDRVWNEKDTDGMAAIYAQDGMLRLAGEAPLVGRASMRDYFAQAFARRPPGFRHVTRITHFQALTPDLVLTDGDVSVDQQQADGSWTVMRRFRTNSVAVRRENGWELLAVRAIPLASPPPTPAARPQG